MGIKQITKTLEKHKFLTYFCAFILIFISMRLLVKPYYEQVDEFIFAEFISGGCYNLVFSNYFLMRLIGLIQDIIYPNNAYVLIYIAITDFAFLALINVLLIKFSKKETLLITAFLSGFFVYSQFLIVSFTRLPTFLCSIGFIYLISYYKRDKWISGYSIGILLIIISSLYRFVVFEAVIAISAAYIFSLLMKKYLSNNNKNLLIFIKDEFHTKKVLSLLLCFAVCLSLYYCSESINTSTDELKYYRQYTSYRSAIVDYKIPEYTEAKEEYDKIGIDENDLVLLSNHSVDDNGAFTLNNLKAITAIKENYYKNEKSFTPVIKRIITSLFNDYKQFNIKAVIISLFILTLIAFLILQNKRQYIIPAILILAILALIYYLQIEGRTPYRSLYPLFFPSILYLLFSIERNEHRKIINRIKESKLNKTIILIPVVAFILLSGMFISVYNDEVMELTNNSGELKTELSDYIKSNPNNKYELTGLASLFEGNRELKSIYYIKRIDSSINYKSFDDTYYRLPYDNQNMKMILNTDNMYTNLVEDGVYYVAYNQSTATPEVYKKYLEKYYFKNQTVSYKAVKKLRVFTVYDFDLEKND